MRATFKNGIHPPAHKRIVEDIAIDFITPKIGCEMVYPLTQHIGAQCEPLIEIGDRVLVGQKIADSSAYVAAPIHSSVSGTVVAIRPHVTPSGFNVESIIIENDALFEEHESIKIPTKQYFEYSREEVIAIIREAGIVGLGGAGFPTHIKLSPPPDKIIDTIMVNAAECEPFLTTDYRVLLEEGDRLILGLKVILHIFPNACGIIAIEDNKPKAIKIMKDLASKEPNIHIKVLKSKYPQGCEKQLIYALNGKEVPIGGLPADVGCIVQNVDTVIAIHRAFFRGRPLMRKVVTLSGGAIKNPGNYKVRIGMPLSELIEVAGGFTEKPAKLIAGGPMMGVALYTPNVPLIKTSSGILCLTEEEAFIPPEQNCIRCGQCINHCPINLLPYRLNEHALVRDFEQFEKDFGTQCIECGSCSYICPAKRHLTQSIRAVKRTILAKNKK